MTALEKVGAVAAESPAAVSSGCDVVISMLPSDAILSADLALEAAAAADMPLPSTHIWRDHLLRAIERGEGALDWAVMAREQARASGLDK